MTTTKTMINRKLLFLKHRGRRDIYFTCLLLLGFHTAHLIFLGIGLTSSLQGRRKSTIPL